MPPRPGPRPKKVLRCPITTSQRGRLRCPLRTILIEFLDPLVFSGEADREPTLSPLRGFTGSDGNTAQGSAPMHRGVQVATLMLQTDAWPRAGG